ncbi:hypothetical protein [Klebsiella pneumoniae]|nr:hypothetical protein [Klebsiella pneumoniae]
MKSGTSALTDRRLSRVQRAILAVDEIVNANRRGHKTGVEFWTRRLG